MCEPHGDARGKVRGLTNIAIPRTKLLAWYNKCLVNTGYKDIMVAMLEELYTRIIFGRFLNKTDLTGDGVCFFLLFIPFFLYNMFSLGC